jgi:hypothetical protein
MKANYSQMFMCKEDAEDLLELRQAQKEEANEPTISLPEVEKEFGIQ